ncbi:synaptobrevin homolog YKT6 [Trichonephila clavata]|uniref:Synaptobrevin homolog YKT6 n=1 Tax=Trichonephila clavata TaxID=2740835 RepID=A0A8X6H6W3_TRICU|nr:synaptobrevin homolog YKT6 [Trichonephila clavata]
MVKMYYLALVRKQGLKGVVLCSSSDLSDFSYFQRKSVKEFMRFSSLMLVGRTEAEKKVSVKEQRYLCHAYVRSDDLAAVAVTNDEYPPNVAHLCLSQLLTDFTAQIQPRTWQNADGSIDFPDINITFEKFSVPKDLDSLAVIQGQLDETKIILHQTLDNILQRGEKLDDLVTKADDLSLQAKTFYKSARKSNACCSGLG